MLKRRISLETDLGNGIKRTLVSPTSSPGGQISSLSNGIGSNSLSRRREELFHEGIEEKSIIISSSSSSSSSPVKVVEIVEKLSSKSVSPSEPLVELSPEILHVQKVLREHFLFCGMADGDFERIVRAMHKLTINAGEVIIQEGSVGDFLYVVESGSLEVTQQNVPGASDILTRDRVFGELALIYDCPRAATVTAIEESTLWSLSSVVFRELVSRFMNENLERRMEKLRSIPAFVKLTDDQLRRVSAVMQEERFSPGTEICYQGEVLVPGVNDKFYTILEGSVMVTSAGLPRRSSRDGQPNSRLGSRRTSPSNLLISPSGSYTPAVLPSPRQQIMLPAAPNVTPIVLPSPRLVPEASDPLRKFHPPPRRSSGDSIGTDDSSTASPSRLVSLGTLNPGEWFGEIALMSDAPRSANVIALGNMGAGNGDTVCLTLSRGAFEQIISPSPAQVTISGAAETRKADNHEIKLRHQKGETAASLTLDSLQIGEIIGEGGFSVVRIVTDPISKEVFALKTMNKSDLVKRKQVAHVNNESRILKEMSHPFILSLLKTFQDDRRIYMVLEFMQGGELFSRVLKSGGGLLPYHSQFYAACVIEGLDYLHRKRIAYRDLKLENLVIGTDGYVKIIDFGFAKQLLQGELTRTLCGTPDYLAPEAVTRTGHNHLVDCWGFGVLLYEMLTQYSPFADSTCSGNRMVVFQNIIRGVRHVDWNELARPFRNTLDKLATKGGLDPGTIRKINEEFDNVQDLLYRVWDANPLTRASTKTIKAHPYFSSWDFAALRELSIEAPWIPDLEGLNDLRYFDVDAFKNVKECDYPFDGPADTFIEF